MKRSIIQLICIFSLLLIHASCTDCNKCRKDCADCQVVVDTNDVDTSTILYTMNNDSLIEMVSHAGAGCVAICIVDIPGEGNNPVKEFVLVPVGQDMRPIQHGNWMKGSKRCPPVCDVTLGGGEGEALLTNVPESEKDRFIARLNQVPENVANSVVISLDRLTGLAPHDLLVVMVPDDQPISIMKVTTMEQNTGHESRVHMNPQQ